MDSSGDMAKRKASKLREGVRRKASKLREGVGREPVNKVLKPPFWIHLKGLVHEDFALLGQFCARIIQCNLLPLDIHKMLL